MENTASLTARMAAFARAYHNETSETPVFADTVARRLFTDEEWRQMSGYLIGGADFFAPGRHFASDADALRWIVNTQLAPTPLARARFCEDSLKTAMKTGTAQYVLLGAGLDSFAWRESKCMETLTVFEVDHPLTQADKRERLTRAGLPIPEHLHFVLMDFRCDDLEQALLRAGFDETKKTFFSWLGVSYYLSPQQVEALLRQLAALAPDGSTLLFDYADEGLFGAEEKRVQAMLAMAAAGGEPMRFCLSEWELTTLLEAHHFLLYEHLTPEEIGRAYYARRTDGLAAFEHISYALAVLKNAQFVGTRERILQTALRLFSRNGYEAVSIKDITDRLTMTKAALYKHYGGKREIFESIVERMRQLDAEQARQYEMPAGTVREMEAAYRATPLEALRRYTQAQFRYWTQEPFPAAFRRMLTLEQYRDTEMAALYQQYLAGGPLAYLEDLFRSISGKADEARRLALDFYAPMFLLYSLYDGARDKAEITARLDAHLERFFRQLQQTISESKRI